MNGIGPRVLRPTGARPDMLQVGLGLGLNMRRRYGARPDDHPWFQEMQGKKIDPNLVTYHTLIDGLLKDGRIHSAIRFFLEKLVADHTTQRLQPKPSQRRNQRSENVGWWCPYIIFCFSFPNLLTFSISLSHGRNNSPISLETLVSPILNPLFKTQMPKFPFSTRHSIRIHWFREEDGIETLSAIEAFRVRLALIVGSVSGRIGAAHGPRSDGEEAGVAAAESAARWEVSGGEGVSLEAESEHCLRRSAVSQHWRGEITKFSKLVFLSFG